MPNYRGDGRPCRRRSRLEGAVAGCPILDRYDVPEIHGEARLSSLYGAIRSGLQEICLVSERPRSADPGTLRQSGMPI